MGCKTVNVFETDPTYQLMQLCKLSSWKTKINDGDNKQPTTIDISLENKGISSKQTNSKRE